MNQNKIYALFEYHGDGIMVPKNFLCFKYGTPSVILSWLLNEGYLAEIYSYGQMMGSPSDGKYLRQIEKLMHTTGPTVKTIKSIDLRMPSTCTCRAISKDFSDMKDFSIKVKELLSGSKTGTVLKGEALDSFIRKLEEAAADETKYQTFSKELPDRYL